MSESKMGEFCWNELATTNVQAAKEFYGKVFGWQFSEIDMGDMSYTMVNHNDRSLAGIWSIPKESQNQIPPHWMSYILVENLDQSLEKAIQNGASIVKPASPAGNFGRFAIITDPAGAHIALWQTIGSCKQE